MTMPTPTRWAPRLAGVSVALFVGSFALAELPGGWPTRESLAGTLVHLVPCISLLLVVAVAWRREWLGALAFSALAAWYAATTWHRLDWVLVISGPMLFVAALYVLAFRQRRRAGAA